jgi:peroxiredoxin
MVMVLAKNSICDFGWKARDFTLKGVDGKICTLGDVRGPKGTLIIFICNHCPYVKASIGRIVAEAKALREIGIGVIAIMPNDTATYREDSFDNMKVFAAKHGFTFPYVIDETQEVARAQCTPDFFGFNEQDELQYRGRLDASRTPRRFRASICLALMFACGGKQIYTAKCLLLTQSGAPLSACWFYPIRCPVLNCGSGNETARVHQSNRRFSGLAACCERATLKQTSYWIS